MTTEDLRELEELADIPQNDLRCRYRKECDTRPLYEAVVPDTHRKPQVRRVSVREAKERTSQS